MEEVTPMTQCVNEPGRECRSAAKIARLEERVSQLERDHQKESDFRTTYYADREARAKRDAALDAKVSDMNTKLDLLLTWKNGEQDKPGKFLAGLAEKAAWAICAAVIAYFLARVGL